MRDLKRRAILVATLSSTLVGLAPATAVANGRYPASSAFIFAANEPDFVALRATFGLLLSRDRGKTWDWVCEAGLGLTSSEDPMFTVTPDGTIIGSTFQGVGVSRDKLCSFPLVGGPMKDLVFIDLTTRPGALGEVISLASTYNGQDSNLNPLFKTVLFETKDEGKSFTPLGPPFNPALLGETVDVAPSDGDRIYVTAKKNAVQPNATAHLFTSRDHASSWEENLVPLVGTETSIFIAGVDAKNPDRIYLRTSGATDKPARLLVSDDAGKTSRTIFTSTSALMGFALSPDGERVLTGTTTDGLQVASTKDFVFTQQSKVEIQCLAFSPEGLWACSNEKSGFVAGLSRDEGKTFEPKLHFCEIRGPVTGCPAESTTQVECVLGGKAQKPPFGLLRNLFGCDIPEGGVPDAGADAGASSPAAADDEGCRVGASPPGAGALALIGLASALAMSRRRLAPRGRR
ncbi:MAG: hypothetical protein JST00_06595 [Deltaproteobacteria bacterium]|nr:hypothetical protein [Deltaproteobacteria bacterium]